MIGANSIFPALLIMLTCVVAAIMAMPFLILGVISLLRQKTKRGVVLFLVSSILLAPLPTVFLIGSLTNRHREFIIAKDLSTPTQKIHPSAEIMSSGRGTISQQVWGDLHLDLKMPFGGKLQGDADRLTLVTTQNGDFDTLQVYYEPTLPSEAGQSIEDVFQYWEKFGTVTTRFNKGRFRVIDIGIYTLTLDDVGRAIRFQLERRK